MEVPVERFVEIPIERVLIFFFVITKRVEVPVEKIVEVPVEVVREVEVYVD